METLTVFCNGIPECAKTRVVNENKHKIQFSCLCFDSCNRHEYVNQTLQTRPDYYAVVLCFTKTKNFRTYQKMKLLSRNSAIFG